MEPFIFDENGRFLLEAKHLDFVILTVETWRSHSTDHLGGDRTYFAEFRENRVAIVETLRSPLAITKVDDQFGSSYRFYGKHHLKMRTRGDVIVPRLLTLEVRIDAVNHRVATFFPTRDTTPSGRIIFP